MLHDVLLCLVLGKMDGVQPRRDVETQTLRWLSSQEEEHQNLGKLAQQYKAVISA